MLAYHVNTINKHAKLLHVSSVMLAEFSTASQISSDSFADAVQMFLYHIFLMVK